MKFETEINDSLHSILESNNCASLATISEQNRSHSNTVYFCYDEHINIYFASDKNTEHIKNISLNPSVSLAIWDTPINYAVSHKGLQIEGICKVVSGIDLIKAWSVYIDRFPVFKAKIGGIENITNKIVSMRLYKIDIVRIIITDTNQFGNNVKIIE